MTNMLRTIDGWRFELPLAGLLALSAGFMVFVMPAPLIEAVPGAVNLGDIMQPTFAALAAVLSGLVALGLMLAAGRGVRARHHAAAVYVDAEGEEHEFAPMFAGAPEPEAPIRAPAPATEPTVRVRRADAHPDAPPRAPILATRDLGEPFMDYEPAPAPARTAIPDGDYVELPHAIEDESIARFFHAEPAEVPAAEVEPEAAIEPVEESPAEPEAAEPEAEAPVAEVAPAEPQHVAPQHVEPAPTQAATTSRPERQSIADMMARLDDGMTRRAGRSAPPRDARPALRDALAELNRLAARRS